MTGKELLSAQAAAESPGRQKSKKRPQARGFLPLGVSQMS
jgi:hypothetical protein